MDIAARPDCDSLQDLQEVASGMIIALTMGGDKAH